MPNLHGKVCLVTGGSKGIGKGVAIQLVTYGATCYVTGRDESNLKKLEAEARLRGSTGRCIPVRCDHSVDSEVEALFQRIEEEQGGKLDLLVNNAYSGVQYLIDNAKNHFWDNPPTSWDMINNVGLRNHYFCTVYASRRMVPRREGLIVNISSIGGKVYFQMPEYGIGKAAKDRMVRDCAAELLRFNVAFVGLWPGPVMTEKLKEVLDPLKEKQILTSEEEQMQTLFSNAETSEFAGKGIAYLLADKKIMEKSGQVLMTSDLADEYGFRDVNGNLPTSLRSVQGITALGKYRALAPYIPRCLKIPKPIFFFLLEFSKARLPRKQASRFE